MPPTLWVSGNRYVFPVVRMQVAQSDGTDKLKEHIYSVTPDASLLVGKPNLGNISNYYIGEVITDEEVAAVQAAAEKYDLDVLNTR